MLSVAFTWATEKKEKSVVCEEGGEMGTEDPLLLETLLFLLNHVFFLADFFKQKQYNL